MMGCSSFTISIHHYQPRRFSMKKMMVSIAAVACLMCMGSYSFADEMGKMKSEMKGNEMKAEMKTKHDEMKAKTDEMKAKTDEMKSEMKMKKDEMKGEKMRSDHMKGEMKGAAGY
jgi:outer membrane murein-binding lipoprotein Lpp